MRNSLYHKTLRVTAVLTALVLVFDSGALSDTTERISLQTRQFMATAVGMYASVESNELNELTAALTERQRALDAREREIDARATDNSSAPLDLSSYILSALLFVILVLIVLNYIFDWMRARKQRMNYANPA